MTEAEWLAATDPGEMLRVVGEGGLGDDRHVAQLAGHAHGLDELVKVAEGLQDQDVDAGAFPVPEQSLDLLT